MKKGIIIFVLILITSAQLFAQEDMPPQDKRMRMKIERLEKMQLLEVLDLDEETAVRFFTRKKENMKEARKLMEQRDKLIEKLKDKIQNGNGNYAGLIQKILDVENEIANKKAEFINSLKDILTEEQIAKVVVFDYTFKREIKDYLFRHRRGMKNMRN
ncbi:MAG: hypothetical protein D6830_04250 [Ignavibacteria bacterium]|nr:MAG: hypothetical protein D6830_04250 [Ignavibacteria bacterium]